MNIEQLRTDFEAWYRTEFPEDISDSTFIYYESCNRYQRPYIERMWTTYQAGRASLQSQDREAASTAVDASMEAVRKQFCELPRYSFITRKGGVSRVHDRTGNWIEFDQAHALFDPVNVDHARRVEGES